VVTGSVDVTLADYSITKPKVANILSINDRGSVEWQLFFVRSASDEASITTTSTVSTTPTTVDGSAAPASPAQIKVGQSEYGQILVDELGRTLYMFGPDTPGKSTCFDDCITGWPAVATRGTPLAGPGVDARSLSALTRPDGTQQVQYHGMPLYLCGSELPGAADCQGTDDVWFVVSPGGDPILDVEPPTSQP